MENDKIVPKNIPLVLHLQNPIFGIKSFINNKNDKDCNGTRIHNQSAGKQTLNHLPELVYTSLAYGRVFVYELSGCGFESRCSHLNFRYRA